MSPGSKALLHVLSGPPGPERAQSLSECLARIGGARSVSVILEGAPANGQTEVPDDFAGSAHILAAGCPCCTGNLALRVTLARILRLEKPSDLVIGVIAPEHEGSLRALLAEAPWAPWVATA